MNGTEVVPSFGNAGRHTHGYAFASLVLKGGYEESGDAGRFDVREGDVILHERFEAHCNRGSRLGAVILHVALPTGADFQSGAGQLADPDLIARVVERSPASAAALLLQTTDFYTTVLIGRNIDAAPRFLSPEYLQHSGDMPSGRKAFMDLFRAKFAKKPPLDYKREILRVVGDNDIVIIFNRQSGTDDKGKHHLVLQFDMFRVENGVIVEHWDAD